MALWDNVKRQLRSVIEWENADPNVLFHLWSENGDEIKNASKLIVKPGQGVVFVYEGKVQAVHQQEGLFELSTANIPIITTISKFMQAFESEHKVGIYYFWRTEILNLKWGTPGPVKYADPVYKFPVGLRAFGNFSFKISKPDEFFRNIVGSRPTLTVEEVKKAIAARFVQPLTDLLAESGFSYIEIDKNRDELGTALTTKLKPDFEKLGFEMTDFRIENTDFDEDTVRRIGRIADMSAEGQAAQAAGINFVQMQQLEALREAARNEGGIAGVGAGVGAGMSIGQMFAGGMAAPQPAAPAAAAAGAAVAAGNDTATRLKKLKELLDQQLISADEFEKKKAEILSSI